MVPMLWHSAQTPNPGTIVWSAQTQEGKIYFFRNRNILHTLKKEPLNIMLLHTGRTMDGPWIKTVPVVYHILDVSSSTGLGIEGCRTCWKDELGNHTLGTKAQNMHHTGRTMVGPWIKMVPVVSCIFYVSSSTGLGIEDYRTCWKDE